MRGQRIIVGTTSGNELECWVISEVVVVVAVFVVGENSQQSLPQHFVDRMCTPRALIGDALDHSFGEFPSSIELPDGNEPGIRRNLYVCSLDDDVLIHRILKQQLLRSLLLHQRPPSSSESVL